MTHYSRDSHENQHRPERAGIGMGREETGRKRDRACVCGRLTANGERRKVIDPVDRARTERRVRNTRRKRIHVSFRFVPFHFASFRFVYRFSLFFRFSFIVKDRGVRPCSLLSATSTHSQLVRARFFDSSVWSVSSVSSRSRRFGRLTDRRRRAKGNSLDSPTLRAAHFCADLVPAANRVAGKVYCVDVVNCTVNFTPENIRKSSNTLQAEFE